MGLVHDRAPAQYVTTGAPPPEGSPCAMDGCPEEHRHPITGEPPDYHWKGRGRHEPRWRNPYKRAPDKQDWWYTASEIAKVLHLTVKTVRAMVSRGALGAVRTQGGHIRIKMRDFEAWYRNQGKVAA